MALPRSFRTIQYSVPLATPRAATLIDFRRLQVFRGETASAVIKVLCGHDSTTEENKSAVKGVFYFLHKLIGLPV